MHPPGRTRWSALLSPNLPSTLFLRIVARALVAGEQAPDAIAARLTETLGHPWRWIPELARRYRAIFAPHTRPRLRDVVAFLHNDAAFLRACQRHAHALRIAQWTTDPARMAPVRAARNWPIPAIETIDALCQWLSLTPGELAWFADRKHLAAKSTPPSEGNPVPLQHYHYRILAKPNGAIRLIEIPKPRLKELQRQILHEILDHIPCHEAVHGFRKARSITTFATPHIGQTVVLRMDLQDFFPSFSAARVQALFRTAGYPESVADVLAGICTNVAPRGLFTRHQLSLDPTLVRNARTLYGRPHLPQGTPTSPALANCLTYRVDCRLSGLAAIAGATYTRYADDLAFSGDNAFARRAARFSLHVAAILDEEGLAIHHRKTRLMRRSVRQYLAGTVLNQHLNIPRPDFDRLKATLTNCLRNGHSTQNRDAHPNFREHLAGRISFVRMVNPAKAQKLLDIFNQIDWN
jgi:RNA-directed DNA polymerase